ncbi:NADH-quinone oxidoreductase subunit G [Microlunatus ginsengisoli]|uniref:NADH-quinone oxidoreductase n=1 Tax=Microlunatus ginsengisoli TaxID=363863 RepID=A0ABP6ZQI6_9ACTN
MTVTSNAGADVEKREDLVTLTIDDVEVSVPKGTLVIRAAELIGTEIPRFCDHPLLDPVGACRQCLVEVPDAGNGRPIPKPQASCTLEVAPGMVVKTQVTSPVADKAQHGNMEFLLINHPLDCPICDKGGECPLQNQAMSHGYGESRFTDVKRTYPKPIHISAQVLLDRERCVLCARCTRFSEQVSGDPFIALIERGALQQVGIYERQPYESYFSGNVIQICPVGALTSAEYRFRSRPFDLVSVPSIAEHDACGSAIRIDYRRGTVMRRMAGDDPEVNEEWITDKDRFAFVYGRGPDRLTRPLVRDGDVLRPASWPEAIDVAVRGLKAALDGTLNAEPDEVGGAGGSSPRENSIGVGVITGGRLTVEDAYAYGKFARTVLGSNDIDFRSRPHSHEEAEFLAHAVAGRGVAFGTAGAVTYADLESASGVLLVALEAEDEAGAIFLRLRKAFRKRGLKSWTLAPYLGNGARKHGATLIPTVPGDEPATLDRIGADDLDADAVILVGERAAIVPGTLSAVLRLAERTGARLAWVPRRAGDRGAVEAGCLPNLLPGGRPVTDAAARVDTQAAWGLDVLPGHDGRDADEMLRAAGHGELAALIVAGVDPNDLSDPESALHGLENAGFVVSIETRQTAVTERADVVLPVTLMEQRSGTFLDWEGRERGFEAAIPRPTELTDLRVLAALADAFGTDLGFRTPAQARSELIELGAWQGPRRIAPDTSPQQSVSPEGGQAILASWRLGLDESSAMAGEPHLMATARRPVLRLGPATAADAGITNAATIGTERGSITLPVEIVDDMPVGVVWAPTRAPRHGLAENLAAVAGDLVTLTPVVASPPSHHDAGGSES